MVRCDRPQCHISEEMEPPKSTSLFLTSVLRNKRCPDTFGSVPSRSQVSYRVSFAFTFQYFSISIAFTLLEPTVFCTPYLLGSIGVSLDLANR